jgi:hypothetical protein
MGNTRAATTIILMAGLALAGCAGGEDLPSSAPLTAAADEPEGSGAEGAQEEPMSTFAPADVVEPTPEPSVPVSTFEGISGQYFLEDPTNIGSGCVLTPEQVQQMLAAWVPAGAVALDEQYSTNYGNCTYNIGRNTLPGGGGYTMRNGSYDLSFSTTRYRYVDDQRITSSSLDGERTFGGSTPEEVIETSFVRLRDIHSAGSTPPPPQMHPEIGQGLVLAGTGDGFYLAGAEHWYDAGFSGGGVANDPDLAQALLELAALIAANE